MKKSNARASAPTPRWHDLVDETSDQSFPASDPPSWSLLHAGAPRQRAEGDAGQRTQGEGGQREAPHDEGE